MDEQISEILAECLEGIENGTTTAAECLQKYPQYASELRSLLTTYQAVKAVPVVKPSLQFRQNAKERLERKISLTQSAKPQKARPRRVGFGLRKAVTAGLIVFIFLSATGVGAAYASSDDLPGDPLYGVKTTVEDVQLVFSDDEGDIELLNEFSNRRVDEIKALTEAGRYEDIPTAVQSFEKTNNKLNDSVNKLAEKNPEKAQELSAKLEEARTTRTETLTSLLDKVPDQAQKGIQTAIDAGPPEDRGKPKDAGCPPEDKGKPKDTGKPEDDKEKATPNGQANGKGSGKGNDKGNSGDNGGGKPEGTETPDNTGKGQGSENGNKPNCESTPEE